jgi:hypothetical protein
LFAKGEVLECPECGVRLVGMDKLPLSVEALHDEIEAGEVELPEDRVLPWTYFGRGRGALLVLAVLGMISFFLPWVELRMPEMEVRSGFDLARGRAGWLWGGFVGWVVLIPLAWTRRTISKMRGVRMIAMMFAAMTLIEVIMLHAIPARSDPRLPVDLSWRFGLYVSGTLSLIGVVIAFFFGGSLDALPKVVTELTTKHESSAGHTLH